MMISERKRIETVIKNVSTLLEREKNNTDQIRLCARQLDALLSENTENIDFWRDRAFESDITSVFKVTLCKFLSKRPEFCATAYSALRGDNDDVSDVAKGRIAYVRNKRNDKMFLEFSKVVEGAKAYYCSSFSDACEAVFNNTCEFCILPVYNGLEGKIYSFYNMLDRYELKIAHIVTEEDADSQNTVTFALVGREVMLSDEGAGKYRFEFSLIGENATVVSNVNEAVRELNGVVTDVGTMPVAYDRPGRRFYLSADIPSEEIIPLTVYLSIEDPGFDILGVYEI